MYILRDGSYKNGLFNGIVKNYTDDHILLSMDSYKDGKMNGVCFKYHKNGKIEKELNYKNGKKNGSLILYDESGIMLNKKKYKNNELNGKSINLFPTKEINVYEQDELQSVVKYNKKERIWCVKGYKDGACYITIRVVTFGFRIDHNIYYLGDYWNKKSIKKRSLYYKNKLVFFY